MPKRPNIVYVMPDEWRPDCFGFAGNRVVQTPNIDALAARGAVFENAHCESPVCMASRASLLTGKFVRDHGLKDNSWLKWAGGAGFPAPDFTRTFLHRLQDAGYYTAEVGKMHFRGPRFQGDGRPGLNMRRMFGGGGDLVQAAPMTAAYGFHEVHEEGDKPALRFLSSEYTRYLADKGLLDNWREYQSSAPGAGPTGPEILDPDDTLDGYIGLRSARLIREYDRDEPFFLWVGFIGPHPPYDGAREFSDRYDPADIPMGPMGLPQIPDNAWGEYLRWNVEHLRCDRLDEQAYRNIAKYYYGSCSLIDHYVGEIVRAIGEGSAKRGREGSTSDRETWILFGSDHGELLGDHGLISKRVFYNTSVKVPNIIVPPSGTPGRSVKGLTQGFDITATALAIAGADATGHDGRSLLPALEGGDVTREAVFSEIAGFLMVFDGRHKLVLHRDTLEPQWMHDLLNDPDEVTDVLKDREVVNELVERFAKPYVA